MKVETAITERFSDQKVLVVGDAVADQFLRGNIDRVSREAPVFILKHESTKTVGGGAANTASNAAGLGARTSLVGVVGDDLNGEMLVDSLIEDGVITDSLIRRSDFETTTKLRILAGQRYAARQQVIRIDYTNDSSLPDEKTIAELRNAALTELSSASALILSDYGYGVADRLFPELIESANQESIPVLIDSRHRLAEYPGATAATPNKEETERILESDFEIGRCRDLRERLRVRYLLVTLGNRGMVLIDDSDIVEIPVIGSDQPVDVTGAGDTVIAVFALSLACGLNALSAARIANHAGGIVVMKHGTARVTVSELIASIKTHEPDLLNNE